MLNYPFMWIDNTLSLYLSWTITEEKHHEPWVALHMTMLILYVIGRTINWKCSNRLFCVHGKIEWNSSKNNGTRICVESYQTHWQDTANKKVIHKMICACKGYSSLFLYRLVCKTTFIYFTTMIYTRLDCMTIYLQYSQCLTRITMRMFCYHIEPQNVLLAHERSYYAPILGVFCEALNKPLEALHKVSM